MAAIFIAKNTMFQLSKAFLQSLPFTGSSRKVSRVCFITTASQYPEGRNAYEERDPKTDMASGDTDTSAESDEVEMSYVLEDAIEGAKEYEKKETAESAGEEAKEVTNGAAETAQSAKEKAKEGTERASQTAYELKEKGKEKAHGLKEKTQEVADSAASKASETMQSVGEKAKQTVEGALAAGKGTTQKIKETVVEKSEEEEAEVKRIDDDDVDLRRPAGRREDHERKF